MNSGITELLIFLNVRLAIYDKVVSYNSVFGKRRGGVAEWSKLIRSKIFPFFARWLVCSAALTPRGQIDHK